LEAYVGFSSKCPSKYRCFAKGDIAKTINLVTIDPNYKVLLICGSFFIMPEARGYFEPSLIQHPEENMNEAFILER
jgi:hypothetical protein